MAPPLDPSMLRDDASATVATEVDPEATAQVMTLGNEMVDLRDEIRDLDGQLRQMRARYDEIRKDKLPESMHAAGMVSSSGHGSVTLANGTKIHLQGDLHVALPTRNRDEFYRVLRENGDDALIKRTVHYGSMRAWTRERLANGLEVPDCLKVHTYMKAVARGGRKK